MVQNQGYSQDTESNEGYSEAAPMYTTHRSVEKQQMPSDTNYTNCSETFSARSSSGELYLHQGAGFPTNEPIQQSNNRNVIHIDSRTQCHQGTIHSDPPSQNTLRYEVNLEQFRPHADNQEQKYISKAHIDRDYSENYELEHKRGSRQDQDQTLYQSYYEFKPNVECSEDSVSENKEQYVDNESHGKHCSGSSSPVFKKPADRQQRQFEQREDSQSLFIDYEHTSNRKKQADYEAENKAYVENRNFEQRQEQQGIEAQPAHTSLSSKSGSSSDTSLVNSSFTSTFSFVPHRPSASRSMKTETVTSSKCEAPFPGTPQTFRSYIGHSFLQDDNQQLQRGSSNATSHQSSRSHQSSSPVYNQQEYSHGVPNRQYNSSSPVLWYEDQSNGIPVENNVHYDPETTECARNGGRQENNASIHCSDIENHSNRGSLFDNGPNCQCSGNISENANVPETHQTTCAGPANGTNYQRVGEQHQHVERSRNFQNANSVYDNANSAENFQDSCATIYDNVDNGEDYQKRESPYDNAAGPYEHYLYPPKDDYY